MGKIKDIVKLNRQVDNCSECKLREYTTTWHDETFRNKDENFPKGPYFTIYNYNLMNKGRRKPKFMFIMQNPGVKENNSYKKEIKGFKELKELKYIQKMDKDFIDWLLNTNKKFTKGFIKSLCKHLEENALKRMKEIVEQSNGLSKEKDSPEFNEFRDLFFKIFFVTDLVKCRAKTEWVESKLENEKLGKIKKTKCLEDKEKVSAEKCFDLYLCNEIKKVRPNLIFCFSTRTWEIFCKKFNLKPYGKEANKAYEVNPKITNVHGYLFEIKKPQTFVIPLAHFSKINNSLRNSYFDYLENGLKILLKQRT